MFTSAECRAHAEEKLAAAESNQRHRRRLLTAAQAWLHLADKMREAELPPATGEIIAKVRSTKVRSKKRR
jgi:hypothetical protein